MGSVATKTIVFKPLKFISLGWLLWFLGSCGGATLTHGSGATLARGRAALAHGGGTTSGLEGVSVTLEEQKSFAQQILWFFGVNWNIHELLYSVVIPFEFKPFRSRFRGWGRLDLPILLAVAFSLGLVHHCKECVVCMWRGFK